MYILQGRSTHPSKDFSLNFRLWPVLGHFNVAFYSCILPSTNLLPLSNVNLTCNIINWPLSDLKLINEMNEWTEKKKSALCKPYSAQKDLQKTRSHDCKIFMLFHEIKISTMYEIARNHFNSTHELSDWAGVGIVIGKNSTAFFITIPNF